MQIESMARVIALVQNAYGATQAAWPSALLRAAIVCGCALALILAEAPLPF